MPRIRISLTTTLLGLWVGCTLALSVQAEEGVWSHQALRLSGFGTLGYTADDRSDIAAARDIGQLPRDEERTGPNWRMDSRIGAQLEYKPGPMFDLVAQFVLRDHFKADLASSMELAYIALHPAGELDVRFGRFSYDAFLMSDHRNVGYVYPWVRPPLEFYGWIPIFSVDGVDAAYSLSSSDVLWKFKAQAGQSQVWIPVASGRGGGYHFKADDLTSLSVTRHAGDLRLKVAHSRFTSSREIPVFAPLHSGLDQVGTAGIPVVSAEAAELRKQLSFRGAQITYTTLGADYDDNTWVAQAELGYSTSTVDVVPSSRMGYVSVARRFGFWMPFLMVSTSRPTKGLHRAANDWGGTLNASLRDPAVRTLDALRIDQRTFSVGVRWDFHPRAALKLQLDSSKSQPPGDGVRFIDASITNKENRLNQLTATVDFVF